PSGRRGGRRPSAPRRHAHVPVGLKADFLVRAVAKRLGRRVPAATEVDGIVVKRGQRPLRVDERRLSGDLIRTVLERTDGDLRHLASSFGRGSFCPATDGGSMHPCRGAQSRKPAAARTRRPKTFSTARSLLCSAHGTIESSDGKGAAG